MTLAHRAFALIGSVALVFAGVATSSAASTTVTLPLHGTKMANLAHGTAMVTLVSPGDYKVVVTIAAMPVPSTLKTTPVRHAYVAWAFNPSSMMRPGKTTKGSTGKLNPRAMLGALFPIPLHATSAHTYTGTGTIMMKTMPHILVTAEVSAMVHTPAMPLWGVLISGAPM